MTSDEQIIGSVIKGNTQDYRELMRRYERALYRLTYRILGRREEAEDAAQETFLRAFSKLSACRDRSKFWPWVRKIAVNICMESFRREHPCDDIEDLLETGSPDDDPVVVEVLRRAEAEHIQTAVAELPPAYRTIIVLRFEQQLAHKEISELLGEPLSTVQVRLHRAKKTLAKRLGVMRNEML